MKARKTAAVALLLAVFAATGVLFYKTVWVSLYGREQARIPTEPEGEPMIQVEALREDGKVGRSWSVADQQAIAKLRAGLRKPGTSSATTSQPDERYRLRIRRADSTIDEFEVLLDSANKDKDLTYVIRRNGSSVVTGNAVDTPELRSALQQVLQPPPK